VVLGISEVEINGKTYAIKGPIIEGLIEEFPDNERQTALQQLSDRRGKSSWLVDGVEGIGEFYTTEIEKKVRVQKSLAETRFGEITHLPLVQDSVGVSPAVNDKTPLVQFASDLGVLFQVSGASNLQVGVWNGGTDTFDVTTAHSGSTTRVRAANVVGAYICVYCFNPSNDVAVLRSTAWTSEWSSTGAVVTTTIAAADDVYAITWNATTSVFGWFDLSANTLIVYKNTDNWDSTTVTTLATIKCGAFNGMALYYDLSGNLRVMCAVDDGVWAVNVDSANSETKIIELQADTNNGLGITVWNGQLIIPLGNGNIEVRFWTT